ncbi:anti-sigma factor [Georgenia sp. SYP-B2076]|uniref:anti-sigma factor n=1 Tax=Georgenia sp. SYP-B2076 TaxID=2495881 RepID=UPI000F8C848E|nr:anti-sigma factor [Georgenia sp. SYP-B2076]
MKHPGEETLALLALGEHVGGHDIAEHIAGCPTCRAELAALRRVTDAGRQRPGPGARPGTLERPGALERPADAVWDRIAAELGLGDAPAAAPPAPLAPPRPAAAPLAPPRPAAAPREPAVPARPWWRRRTAWVAAASFAVGVAGTVAAQNLASPSPPPVQTLTRAELEPLPGWRQAGTASVTEVGGERVLAVKLPTDVEGGYREVWLMDSGLKRLVSVGVLAGSEGRFVLPAGLDLAQFPVVDVSDEPYDGNPAHSGDSIVRGKLA